MKAPRIKHWFLLLLLGGIGLAWLRPEWLRPATQRLEPRVVGAAALFLMAWGLESRSLLGALVRPLPALWAVVISYGGLPALAWLMGGFMPDADFRVGLLISASVPCTLASAGLWTRMAGGNEATALAITLLTTLTSWLATTAWLASATGTAVALDTAAMMRDLLLVLCVPVALGQSCRALGPVAHFATRNKTAFGVASRLLILGIILKAAVDVFDRLGEKSSALTAGPLVVTAFLCVGTHVTALLAGLWSSQALGFDRPDRIAVAIAGSQKTLPVALILFQEYFKDRHPLAVVPIVLYHVGQLVVDTFIADMLAGRQPAEPGLPGDTVL